MNQRTAGFGQRMADGGWQLAVFVIDCHWLSLVVIDCHWLSLVVIDC
jgi:hypothetical protein